MKLFINWVKWCIKSKKLLPYNLGSISHSKATQEDLDWANELIKKHGW